MYKRHQLRVLHAAVSMSPSLGVVKQMEWEQQAAKSLNIPWVAVLHTGKNLDSHIVHVWQDLPKFKLIRYYLLRRKFYKWLQIASKDFDLVLLRFSVHDPWQSRLVKKIGHKVLMVHHTKEELELLGIGGLLGHVKRVLEVIWGRGTLKSVIGTISVTAEIDLYQKSRANGILVKPSFLYPNGIGGPSSDSLDLRSKEVPEFIFIASHFAPWHGLDLVIAEIKKNSDNFKIHLVGRIATKDVVEINGDDRFVLYDQLNTKEIQTLIQKMWVGLSSFAMYRNGMTQACTLKVREYLKMGLPVYSGHQDSGLPDDFAFFKNGSLNFSDVVAYAHQVRSMSRADVLVAAEPYIAKDSILSKLYTELQDNIYEKLSSYVAQPGALKGYLSHSHEQCDPAKVKLIAVTGASGFIGNVLVQNLLKQGFKVRALTRQHTKQKLSNLQWYVGDLQTTQDWSCFLQGVDVLIHTAAELNNIDSMQSVNVDGSLRLLHAAISGGVKRWVQISSVGAYGLFRQGWVDESTPTNPKGAYEIYKTQFDDALLRFQKDSAIEYCIIRPSNVFGPGMRNRSLSQMQHMVKKGWFAFVGPTGASANYVYVDDVVNAVAMAAVHPAAANQTYIVSDWTTLENMVFAMAQATNAAQPSLRLPQWIAKMAAYCLYWFPRCPITPSRVRALSNRSRYSTQKIEKELGWKVTVPIVLGVRQLVNYEEA
jgi:nucleoside-diphosphate-sugar epimerase